VSFVYRAAVRADRQALLRLFSAAFGQPPVPEAWEWKYDRNPHSFPSVLALLGEEPVGYFGGVGTRYRGAGGDLTGVAAADVMTHPLHRSLGRRSLFVELGLEFFRVAAEARAPFVFGFPNERHRRTGERSLDYRSIEPAGQWVRPLGSAGLLGRLRRRLLRASVGDRVSRGHETLAEALHARAGWRTDRSRATLDWRFAPHAGASYRLVELLDRRSASRGYAALRIVGERALLVDFQVGDEVSGDLGDLLAATENTLAGTAARWLVLRAPTWSRIGRRVEAEFGFALEPSDCHFEIRPLDPAFDAVAAGHAFDYRFSDHEIF
jgi:hypothetical protein